MCGRFTSTEDKEKITKLFPNSEILNYANKSYNISPSNIVNIIYENNHKLLIDSFIWSYSFFSKKIILLNLLLMQELKRLMINIYSKNHLLKENVLLLQMDTMNGKI